MHAYKPKIYYIDLQLFKGNTTVNNQSYQPTEYELQLQKVQADLANQYAPNASWLNDTAKNILQNSIGAVQYDFNTANNQAQSQINQANQNNQALANGQLPQAALDNITNNVSTIAQNSMGNLLNGLANNGVLNSSVTTTGMKDLSDSVNNIISQQQQSYMNLLNGINNGNISNASAGITTAAGAQEAAQQPALNLWNASTGLASSGNSTLNALAGKGTTTTTQTTSGGGLLGGLFGGLF